MVMFWYILALGASQKMPMVNITLHSSDIIILIEATYIQKLYKITFTSAREKVINNYHAANSFFRVKKQLQEFEQ